MPRRPQGEGAESGPSQTRPSLRDLHSPQPLGKSTVEEDLKKLITLDSPPAVHHDDKVYTLWFLELEIFHSVLLYLLARSSKRLS